MSPITGTLKIRRSLSSQDSWKPLGVQKKFIESLSAESVVAFVGDSCSDVPELLLESLCEEAQLLLLDSDRERLSAAQARWKREKNIVYVEDRLDHLRLPQNSVEALWCQGALEFCDDPRKAFESLVGVVRPAGVFLCEEEDAESAVHYPLAEHLEKQWRESLDKLRRSRNWHPRVGRELYGFFSESGFRDLELETVALHLVYGGSNTEDQDSWRARLERIGSLHSELKTGLSFDWECFCNEYLTSLDNPYRFSYSPVIRVFATKVS